MGNFSDLKMEAKAYPLAKPDGATKAFAAVTFKLGEEDLLVIKGIRVVDGKNGLFVTMPQSKGVDKETGETSYHDIAFPVDGGIRKEMNTQILAEYAKSMSVNRRQDFGERLNEGKEKAAAQKAQQPAPDKTAAKKSTERG